MREKAERAQQLQRQTATQQALAEQVAPEKSLVVPREPWNNEPIMSGPEWVVLPREAQVQKIRENELERVRMERRKAEWKSFTKLPSPTREESIEDILKSIGELREIARKPWEPYIEDTPHLAMRDRRLTMGMNVVAAQRHSYKFLTDPKYRKKIWALPRDLQHPAESGRTIPHAKYTTPSLSSERDVKLEKAKEWWQKATPLKGLFAGEELAEMYELRKKIAGRTATDDDIWKLGHYRARLQIADEKGLLGKTADFTRDMFGYMGEISLAGGPIGGKAVLGTKNLAAGLLKRSPSAVGRGVISQAADIGVGGLVQAALMPGALWESIQAEMPGLEFRPDERGRLEAYMERDARTTGRQVMDGVLKHVMEQMLERSGGLLLGLISKPARGLYKGVEKGFVKAGIIKLPKPGAIKLPGQLQGNVGKMAMAGHLTGKHSKLPGKIGGILTGKRLGAVMKQGGWNGVLPEMLEEMGTAFFEQYINPEHFLSTGKENQWTMIRDWASGARDAKGNIKYTGGEVAKELAPMVLSFITMGAFGAGGRGLSSYLQEGRAEFAAPELPEFALEEGRWKDLVLGEGKESAATFVNQLEEDLIDAARVGTPGEAVNQIRALIELAHAEQAAPSDQNVSRSTFEKIKVPNTDISLYQLLKKKADRKGFLDGLLDHSERLLEISQAVQQATTADVTDEHPLAGKLRTAAQEGEATRFQAAQDEAGRPVHVGGQPAATVGPRGEPLSVIGEPSLGQIPEEAQAEAGVPTMSGLPPTVIGPEGQTLVDPLVRADLGQAPVQPSVEAPADVPAAPAVQQDVPAAPTIEAEAGVNAQVAADLRAEAELLKKGPKRWALEKAAAAIEAHPEEVTRDLKPGVIPGVGKGVVRRIQELLPAQEEVAEEAPARTREELEAEIPLGPEYERLVGRKGPTPVTETVQRLAPTPEQRRERAAQRKAEAEAKAKRGEPVAAEPAAPQAAVEKTTLKLTKRQREYLDDIVGRYPDTIQEISEDHPKEMRDEIERIFSELDRGNLDVDLGSEAGEIVLGQIHSIITEDIVALDNYGGTSQEISGLDRLYHNLRNKLEEALGEEWVEKDQEDIARIDELNRPTAPKAAVDIGQKERDLVGDVASRDPKLKDGEMSLPGSDKPVAYTEEQDAPVFKTMEDWEAAVDKALEDRPYETVFKEGRKPKLGTIINNLASYMRPDLKGDELDAYKVEMRGVAAELLEHINKRADRYHEFEDIVGFTLAPYRREALRIQRTGKKRVPTGEKGPRGGVKYKTIDADSGSIEGLDEIVEAARERPAAAALLSELSESGVFELLTEKIVRVREGSPEVEMALVNYYIERDMPSWAPAMPEFQERNSELFGVIVTGVPSRVGLEPGEVVPALVTGKVISDEAESVVVEVGEGSSRVEYEIPRQDLELYHSADSRREYEFGDDSGTVPYYEAFSPVFLLGSVDPTVVAASVGALLAAKKLRSWLDDTIAVRHVMDSATDLLKVGGLFGKETWQRIQDADAEVRAIQHEISRGFAELDAAIKRSRWKRRLPGMDLSTPTQRLSLDQRDLLNEALDIAPDKLESRIGTGENQLDIPRELLGPIKRISSIQLELSESVAETLPELLKDPEFVKKYDSKKLVQVVLGEGMVHIHRGYLAFENPNWGRYVKKNYPDLVEKFRVALRSKLREEHVDLGTDKIYETLLKDQANKPHTKALLRELKKLKAEAGQGKLFDKSRAKEITRELTEDLDFLRGIAEEEAAKAVDAEIKAGELLTDTQVNGMVESMLSPGRVDPRVRTSLGRMDMRMFLARKLGNIEYHKLVRAVLGEIRDPRARMLRSAEQLASYLHMRSLQQHLYREGIKKGWFLEPMESVVDKREEQELLPDNRHYTEKLPNTLEYGPLAGLRTTKAFKIAMERVFGRDLPGGTSRGSLAVQNLYRTWMGGVAFGKASKTIMNWPTQAMNNITNVAIEFVHGGIPTSPVQLWQAFSATWRSARHGEPLGLRSARSKLSKAKNAEEKARLQKIVDEKEAAFEKKVRSVVVDRIRRGVFHDSPVRELDMLIKEATSGDVEMITAIPRAFDRDTAPFQKAVRFIKRGVKRYWGFHASLYRMGDDLYKGYADTTTIRMLDGAYPPSHPRWKGKTPVQRMEEIKREAALRVRDRYPTSSMTPEAIQLLRKWPVMGTFPTWLSEFVRTQYIEFFHKDGWLQKDLRSGNKRLKVHAMWRYARWAGLHYGANQAMRLLLSTIVGMLPDFEPVDDPEKEAILRSGAAPWDKWKELVFFEHADEDGNKRWTYANLSRVNPYTRIADTWRAFTGPGEFKERLYRGVDTAAGEMISMDMILGRFFHVMKNQKPSGGRVYNKEATPEKIRRDILGYLWSSFKPGEWETVRRLGGLSPWKVPHLFGGIAGDYFRGWGEPDRAGREYNVVLEIMAAIAPRVGVMRPKLNYDIRVGDIGGRFREIQNNVRDAGTNEGWAKQESFEKELRGASYRRSIHLQELARLIRFGHATEIPIADLRNTVQRALSSSGVDKGDARRIVGAALAGRDIVLPLELSRNAIADIKRSSGGAEKMRYFTSRTWETKRPPTKPKIRK